MKHKVLSTCSQISNKVTLLSYPTRSVECHRCWATRRRAHEETGGDIVASAYHLVVSSLTLSLPWLVLINLVSTGFPRLPPPPSDPCHCLNPPPPPPPPSLGNVSILLSLVQVARSAFLLCFPPRQRMRSVVCPQTISSMS